MTTLTASLINCLHRSRGVSAQYFQFVDLAVIRFELLLGRLSTTSKTTTNVRFWITAARWATQSPGRANLSPVWANLSPGWATLSARWASFSRTSFSLIMTSIRIPLTKFLQTLAPITPTLIPIVQTFYILSAFVVVTSVAPLTLM